jgi:toxin YhaV
VFRVGAWTILFHPLLLDQLERLVAAAERERQADRETEGPNAKLVAALRHLMFEEIPEDPSRPRYRHGGALGDDLKHWLRAKCGNGRFRLFFRYRRDAGLLVFAWVNDQHSLRAYGSRTDAYAVFRRMLGEGNPPDDWAALVRAASNSEATHRARRLLRG